MIRPSPQGTQTSLAILRECNKPRDRKSYWRHRRREIAALEGKPYRTMEQIKSEKKPYEHRVTYWREWKRRKKANLQVGGEPGGER